MALLILILIILLMIYFAGKGRAARREVNVIKHDNKQQRTSQEEIDELVTVILPTINHDK